MRTENLRRAELHASVSDPLLDTMNFLNEITHRYPDAISFAPGRPYDGFFDVEDIFAHLRRYIGHLEQVGESPEAIRGALFQYGPTGGRIRELIADSLRVEEGFDVPAESIVVTVGCQEAMLLAVRALMADPRDVLLVASPCYVGITGAARLLDVAVRPVRERADGLHAADVRSAILDEREHGRRPRALYVVPDHSNPSGNTMPRSERRALLELAADEDILLLEDSPYRMISAGERVPMLKSLDPEHRVVCLGSYSKTLFPGARVGYVVADQSVIGEDGSHGLLAAEIAKVKSMVTVNTSALSQAVVAGMLLAVDGRTADLNKETSAYYAAAMQSTLRELDLAFPPAEQADLGIRWNRPTGGFFLTVDVPFRTDEAALEVSAKEFGVIWTPMSYFYPDGGGTHSLRLSISYLAPEEIVQGVGRLAEFIRRNLP